MTYVSCPFNYVSLIGVKSASNILGLSFGYHDSNVSYIDKSGRLICLQEERFSRVKFDKSFPSGSIRYLSSLGGFDPENLNVIFYEDPNLKRVRQIKDLFLRRTFLDVSENQLLDIMNTNRRNFTKIIKDGLSPYANVNRIEFATHHESHAASSFFSSNFAEAAVLVVDAVGEKISTSIWCGENNDLRLCWKQNYPNSLGLFYSSFSNYCGFRVNSGEYKFMGLSPYGNPLYVELLYENFIELNVDGSIGLNLKHIGLNLVDRFDHSEKEKLFGMPQRLTDDNVLQFHADLAKSVQIVLERAMVNLSKHALDITGKNKLCLAGGVALNCVSNEQISNLVGGKNLYIVPASGDSGTSLGALALGLVRNKAITKSKIPFRLDMNGSKLGRCFDPNEVLKILEENYIPFTSAPRESQLNEIANLLAQGEVGAIFEGPAEYGPRALGNRSIVADPRIVNGQIYINLKIKMRESFRPFAPIVLEEEANKYFNTFNPSPYMLITTRVKEFSILSNFKSDNKFSPIDILRCLSSVASPLPAVTHLDGSARIQTIKSTENCFIVELLQSFKQMTGCPVLINTSFNVRGEPIVDTPLEALNCLATTGLDFLWMEGFIIKRKDIPTSSNQLFASRRQED